MLIALACAVRCSADKEGCRACNFFFLRISEEIEVEIVSPWHDRLGTTSSAIFIDLTQDDLADGQPAINPLKLRGARGVSIAG